MDAQSLQSVCTLSNREGGGQELRPAPRSFPRVPYRLAFKLGPWVVFLVVLVAPVAVMMYFTGGPRGLLAFLQGQRLLLETRVVWVGDAKPGQTREITVRFQSLSAGCVTVLGAEATCRCSGPKGPFPVVLAPFGYRDVPVVVTVPANASGEWTTYVRFIADVAREQPIVEVHGGTDKSPPSGESDAPGTNGAPVGSAADLQRSALPRGPPVRRRASCLSARLVFWESANVRSSDCDTGPLRDVVSFDGCRRDRPFRRCRAWRGMHSGYGEQRGTVYSVP
jgi:hypothetical protein